MTRRINAHLVCGGWWHDFDYARLQLLQLLSEHIEIRTTVASDFEDIATIEACDVLISYTCNVLPSEAAQQAMTLLQVWLGNECDGRFLASE